MPKIPNCLGAAGTTVKSPPKSPVNYAHHHPLSPGKLIVNKSKTKF